MSQSVVAEGIVEQQKASNIVFACSMQKTFEDF